MKRIYQISLKTHVENDNLVSHFPRLCSTLAQAYGIAEKYVGNVKWKRKNGRLVSDQVDGRSFTVEIADLDRLADNVLVPDAEWLKTRAIAIQKGYRMTVVGILSI